MGKSAKTKRAQTNKKSKKLRAEIKSSFFARISQLTPEGYLGLIRRENLDQYSDSEVGAEPEGLEVRQVDQQIWKTIEHKLFAGWLSTRLTLRLAAQVRTLHEPETWEDDADRVLQTWTSLLEKMRQLGLSGQADDRVETKDLVGYLVGVAAGSASTGGPAHGQVEGTLHDELTAVQGLAAWEAEPMVPEGFWAPEDLTAQQNQHQMMEDLWFALEESQRSDAITAAKGRRHGAGRVEGLPIVDPPTVQSRNQLIREDQPFYIAAGFLKLFPLGHGDYWAYHANRRENGQELSFMEWLQHLLFRSDGRFQCHPLFFLP